MYSLAKRRRTEDAPPSHSDALPTLHVSQWGLDPLYWSFACLLVKQIHMLDEYSGLAGDAILHDETHDDALLSCSVKCSVVAHATCAEAFHLNNHPLSRAQVVGTVVSILQREKKSVFTGRSLDSRMYGVNVLSAHRINAL